MKRFTETYSGQTFDILIIGGGITGATIAYEAASRGLSVALVEKKDFASATSAATSKMIHGGLRYLATGQFHLVRESLIERQILANIAPNFVYPLPFVFTIYDHMKTPKWAMRTGLILYELLSFDRKTLSTGTRINRHFKTISPQQILNLFPFVKKAGIKGGFLYYDCRNHFPERLTLAFIKSAVSHGAQVANYVKMEKFLYTHQENTTNIKGIVAQDLITGKRLEIKARLVVNATGPWVDITLSKLAGKQSKEHIRRSEGIHIVLNKQLAYKYVFASQSPKGQHFFIIPYRGKTIIGTTDKEYFGNPDDYHVTKKSVDDLIDKVNTVLTPGHKITYKDIAYIYGGLRPLVEDTSGDVYKASRRYEIVDEARHGILGLISAEGGKFTTSRRLAQKVIDLAFKKLGKKHVKSKTASTRLITSDIDDIEEFIQTKAREYPMLNQRQLRYLVYSYGSEFDSLMDIYLSKPDLQFIVNEDGENLAQVVYSIKHEQARTLEDIIMRRSGIGWTGMPQDNVLKRIAHIAASELNWNDNQIINQIENVKKLYNLVNQLKTLDNETKYDIPA